MTLVLVMVGGAAGALVRWAVDRFCRARFGADLPWATLAVNLAGSLLLGLLVGAGSTLSAWWGLLIGTGFCGALTTYSTFAYETVRVAGHRGRGYAVGNVVATVGLGCAAAAIGRILGGLRWVPSTHADDLSEVSRGNAPVRAQRSDGRPVHRVSGDLPRPG